MIGGFIFALFLLVLGLYELKTLFAGAEQSEIPQNISVTGITSNAATINFETQKETSALIAYGTDPQNLSLFTAEAERTKTHAATLSFLAPNTNYYFTIKIGKNTYDENGKPHQFTTKLGSGGTVGAQLQGLDAETFKQKIGTSDPQYDLDTDGIVTTRDYHIFLKKTAE